MHSDLLEPLLHRNALVVVGLVGLLQGGILAARLLAQRRLVLVELAHVLLVALLRRTVGLLGSLDFLVGGIWVLRGEGLLLLLGELVGQLLELVVDAHFVLLELILLRPVQ